MCKGEPGKASAGAPVATITLLSYMVEVMNVLAASCASLGEQLDSAKSRLVSSALG